MARAAKMTDVVAFGRVAKMRIVVRKPATDSVMKITGDVIAEAIRLSGEAEFATQARSRYRNTVVN
jgi:hypothetical protein